MSTAPDGGPGLEPQEVVDWLEIAWISDEATDVAEEAKSAFFYDDVGGGGLTEELFIGDV